MLLKVVGLVGVSCLATTALPLLATPGAGGPGDAGFGAGSAACGELGVILDTIRTVETGGNYQTRVAAASASGAYAFIDESWRHYARQAGVDVARYPSAWMAPPTQQDAAAAVYVHQLLKEHDGEIDVIPVGWYLPAALDDPGLMDQVPFPQAGNRLTVRQYQLRWMNTYHSKLTATPAADGDEAECASVTADGQWALPAPREVRARAELTSPHHDYPAFDLMMPEGTPVFAVTGGTVARTTHFNANWWRAGCDSSHPPDGCATCGVGITVRDVDGNRYTYCHNRMLYVRDGDTVTAGQHIADSGDTGRSGAPHLHLEIRVNDVQRCPQPLLQAVYDNQPPPTVTSLPPAGCTL